MRAGDSASGKRPAAKKAAKQDGGLKGDLTKFADTLRSQVEILHGVGVRLIGVAAGKSEKAAAGAKRSAKRALASASKKLGELAQSI